MSTPVQKMISVAREAMQVSDWPLACDLWAEVRRICPDEPIAYLQGIDALIRAYRFGEIDAVAAAARDNAGSHLHTQMFLATLASRQGRWHEAVQLFDEIAGAFPGQVAGIRNGKVYRQSVFNAEGIIEGSRRLGRLTHATLMQCDPEPVQPRRDRDYAFVSGMPRAGTTALGRMLNMSPNVAMFTEVHIPYLAYEPRSFDRDLLEIRAAGLPAAAPKGLRDRADHAGVVGDKRPLFHYSFPQTMEAMQGQRVTVYHMMRSVAHVVASYHARAANPGDKWDPLRDLHHAIDELNVMHQFILDWNARGPMQQGHRLVYVDYGRAFSEFDYAVKLFEHLGPLVNLKLRRALSSYISRSVAILSRPREVAPDILEAVAQRLDMDAARDVVALTGIDILADLPN